MVEMLRGAGNARLGLDGFLQGADDRVGGDFEGEKVGIFMAGCSNSESDTPSQEVNLRLLH